MGSFGKKTNNNSNNPKKKKVPKGKRARAKAKLDRQWGEIQQQQQQQQQQQNTTETSSFRRGKSRLLSKTPNDKTQVAEAEAAVAKENKNRHVTPHQKWKQQQQQKQQFVHPINGDDDESSSSSSSSICVRSDDDEDSSDVHSSSIEIKNPLQELVTMIRNKKKKKKTKKQSTSSSLFSNQQRTDQKLRHGASMSSDSGSNSNSHNNSEDDNDDDDDDDEESYRSDSSHHDYNNNDDDDDDDDPNENETVVELGIDIPTTSTSNDKDDFLLFLRHFRRPPLSKDELSRLSPQKTTRDRTIPTTTTKIPIQSTTTSHDDGTVELQVQTTTAATTTTTLSNQRQGNMADQLQANEETKDMQQLLSLTTHQQWQREASAIFTDHTNSLLQRQWNSVHGIDTNKNKKKDFMDPLQAPLYSFLSRYCDTLVTTTSTPTTAGSSYTLWKKAQKEQDQWHQMYLLHILNHVLTKQLIIKRNNQKEGSSEINEQVQQQHTTTTTKTTATTTTDDDDDNDDSISMDTEMLRDQGFTRPAVLVLLPTRGTCHEFISNMLRLLGTDLDPTIHERFQADYGELVDDGNDGDNHDNTNSKNSTSEKEMRRKQVLKQKGREWNKLFGETANQDDDFKIGIAISSSSSNNNKKKKKHNKNNSNQNQPQSPISVRLYADFFNSDIIVASPLGLKMVLTNHDEDAGDDDEEKGRSSNVDFLSSIEICLLQHSDVMLMQNWDHVNDILDALNQPPQHNNNTDFSRVRQYLLEGQGEHWRQLILSTKFVDPTLISSFKRFGKSHSGSVKVRRKTPSDEASIASVLLPITQVFHKVPVGSFAQQSQAKVEYFVKHLLPQIQKHQQKHTLVFIPSYFDYCSLRNAFLKLESVSFVSVTEYSRTSEIGRGRARFLQGRKPILLYTGRAHYFHRHAIKGIKHLVFLGLPEHASFYAEYVNLIGTLGASSTNKKVMENDDDDDIMDMADHSATSCVVLFTKYEAHALERVVGSKNCSQMLSSSKRTFMFHS
ncbi:UTP25, U3 small nucleolar RNA-associated SSU processome protein 25 [Nitzschia inconspicua]|uniref:UTP25, U3 small nucleolar RNA-associated SSU processome protein 25 n=1 Tax=Nitzschia inconspicua TaxID=303405 RepID=A0A9K3PBJ2_9STRA|nr:UTP25, U3 small nucleolar RNA-associated SSU processome protein 25 [Nitzschia inconspicua]